jgi:hypothetical protein
LNTLPSLLQVASESLLELVVVERRMRFLGHSRVTRDASVEVLLEKELRVEVRVPVVASRQSGERELGGWGDEKGGRVGGWEASSVGGSKGAGLRELSTRDGGAGLSCRGANEEGHAEDEVEERADVHLAVRRNNVEVRGKMVSFAQIKVAEIAWHVLRRGWDWGERRKFCRRR